MDNKPRDLTCNSGTCGEIEAKEKATNHRRVVEADASAIWAKMWTTVNMTMAQTAALGFIKGDVEKR